MVAMNEFEAQQLLSLLSKMNEKLERIAREMELARKGTEEANTRRTAAFHSVYGAPPQQQQQKAGAVYPFP